MNFYSKNSFDRFGDDLTELILSHLWFEDKVRVECVATRWQRVVYNSHFVIVIETKFKDHWLVIQLGTTEIPEQIETKNGLRRLVTNISITEAIINRQVLESVLKKCPNIRTVELKLRPESEGLSLIGQYCDNFKSLSLDYSCIGDEILKFGRE